MHQDDARKGERIQCANAIPVTFTLADPAGNRATGFCVCTDLSPEGARFFTDIEFFEHQKLQLTIAFDGGVHEQVAVTVSKADSSLYDDERYCADVIFDQALACYQQLVRVSRQPSQPIAA